MNQSFSSAINAEQPEQLLSKQQVFVSEWLGTLSDVSWNDFELLKFLSDAKEAGHRVIITPDSDMHLVPLLLEALTELGRAKGYHLVNADQYELIHINRFESQKIAVDYSFDREKFAPQLLSDTIGHPMEIPAYAPRTGRLFPMPMLRIVHDIPVKNKEGEQSASAPSPTAF